MLPYLHREAQYEAIRHALTKQHNAPKIVHIFGQSRTDKTAVTLHALESCKVQFAYIDCASMSIGSANSILQIAETDIRAIIDVERSILTTGSISNSALLPQAHSSPDTSSRLVYVLDNSDLLMESWLNSFQLDNAAKLAPTSLHASSKKVGFQTELSNVSVDDAVDSMGPAIDQRVDSNPGLSSAFQRASDDRPLVSAILNIFDQLRVDGAIVMITKQKQPRVHSAFLELFIESQIQFIQFLPYSPQERYEILSTSLPPPTATPAIPNRIVRTLHDWFSISSSSGPASLPHFLPSASATDHGLINPNISVTFQTSTILSTLSQRLTQLSTQKIPQDALTNHLSRLTHTFQSILAPQADSNTSRIILLLPSSASATRFEEENNATKSIYVPFNTIPNNQTSNTITIPLLHILPLNHCRSIVQRECTSSRHNLSNPALYLQCYYKLTIAAFHTILQSLVYLTLNLHFTNISPTEIHDWCDSMLNLKQPTQHTMSDAVDESNVGQIPETDFTFSTLLTTMYSALDEADPALHQLSPNHATIQHNSALPLHHLLAFSRHLFITLRPQRTLLTDNTILALNPIEALSTLYEPMYISPPSHIDLAPTTHLTTPDQPQTQDLQPQSVRARMDSTKLNQSTTQVADISLSKRILSQTQHYHLLLNFADLEPIYVDYYLFNNHHQSKLNHCIVLKHVLPLTNINQTLSPLRHLSPPHYIMLIACFLACFVSQRDDAKLFSIEASSGKRRPRPDTKLSHLQGALDHLSPQSAKLAPLDRLLNVYRYVLVNSTKVQSAHQQTFSTSDIAFRAQFSDPTRHQQLHTAFQQHIQQQQQQQQQQSQHQYDAILFTSYSEYNVNTLLTVLMELLGLHFILYLPTTITFKSTLSVEQLLPIAQQIGFNFAGLIAQL